MPELPSAGAQRVTFGDDGRSATLVVDMHDNLVASGEDAANTEYLEATTMVDGDDPLVRKLAQKAIRKTADGDVAVRADAMRAFVNRHISKKSLGTAFATASETAKTRTGDCSEHAVLLCAMLRADGIPARVASGLVYADQFAGQRDIFGWHMWTQALIDGRWVDLDATLPNRYNAAHVLTGVSSLATGGLEKDLSSMMLLIGNLEIDVVEVGHDVPDP
jgi:transglutaminase-like putative cysteine protease